MESLALALAVFLLANLLVALRRVLRGPTEADRMLTALLFGTTGVAVLLLLAEAQGMPALVDVALVFALLAAVSGAAFTQRACARMPGARMPGARMPGVATMTIGELLSVPALLAGCAFFLAGTVGLLRFPDVYTRLHALTKVDNLGLGFIVLGLALRASSPALGLKLVLIWVLALAAAATVAHLIARRALAHGIVPVTEGGTDGARARGDGP